MPTPTRTAELSSQLRLSVMRLSRRLRAERADLTLTLTQLATLSTLHRCGPLSPRDLADKEKVQPPSMTRVLGALEDRGLVRRTPHPTDGRQQLVSLTAAAVTMIKEDKRRRDAWLSRRLAEFTTQERAVLRAAAPLLERLGSA